MMENNEDDVIIIWEAPKIVPPEFRLYHDDDGKVLFYTCEKPDGKYVVVDAQTYAEGRPDVRVIDGRVLPMNSNAVISKLVQSTDEGQSCPAEDVSIIAPAAYKGKKIKWKVITTVL